LFSTTSTSQVSTIIVSRSLFIGCGFLICCTTLSTRLSSSLGTFLEGLDFISITVEEEIDSYIPLGITRDGTAETEDLTSQEPVEETNGVTSLVVGRDGNVNVSERGVRVAEGNDGDTHVRGFTNGLVISTRISDDQETRFLVLQKNNFREEEKNGMEKNLKKQKCKYFEKNIYDKSCKYTIYVAARAHM
jgi:hypothetical protein